MLGISSLRGSMPLSLISLWRGGGHSGKGYSKVFVPPAQKAEASEAISGLLFLFLKRNGHPLCLLLVNRKSVPKSLLPACILFSQVEWSRSCKLAVL